MRDPFRPNSNHQLVRESRMGLSIVAVLVALLIYVAYYRITNRDRELPENVRNAPVAEMVWPGERKMASRPPVINQVASNQAVSNQVAPNSPKSNSNATNSASSFVQSNQPLIPRNSSLISPPTFEPKSNLIRDPLVAQVNSTTPIAPSPVVDDPFASKPVIIKSDPSVVTASKIAAEPPKPFAPMTPSSNAFVSSPMKDSRSSSQMKIEPAPKAFTPVAADSKTEPFVLPPTNSNLQPWRPEFSAEPDTALSIPEPDEQTKPDTTEFKPVIPKQRTSSLPLTTSESEFSPTPSNTFPSQPNSLRSKSSFTNEIPHGKLLTLETPIEVSKSDTNSIQVFESNSLIEPNVNPNIKPKSNIESNVRNPVQSPPSLGELQPQALATLIERDGRTIYKTKSNDDFWSIAQNCYGDGRFFRALYRFNDTHVQSFESLPIGTELTIPRKRDLQKLWPKLCPQDSFTNKTVANTPEASNSDFQQTDASQNASDRGQVYETFPGDTLFEIARQRLGQASRYVELLQLNENRLGGNVNHMTPLRGGIQLELPVGQQ